MILGCNMDSLNHLLFAVLLVTPAGLSSYRLTGKIVLCYGATVGIGYSIFGLSMNFIHFTDLVAGLLILYILYLAWIKKKPFFKLFMLVTATVIIAGQSHGADQLLGLFAEVPSKSCSLRPHNLWHTPIFAFLLSVIATLLIPRLLNFVRKGASKFRDVQWSKFDLKFVPLLASTYLGYLLHVFADTITYDFDVWWAFPLSDINFSLYQLADAGELLAGDPTNPWGWWYFYLTPALVVCAIVFVCLIYLIRKDE